MSVATGVLLAALRAPLLLAQAAATIERLRRNIERYYSQPLEVMQMIQASFAGTPAEVSDWLNQYVKAGARHIVLRITDEDSQRCGLEAAGHARELLAETP